MLPGCSFILYYKRVFSCSSITCYKNSRFIAIIYADFIFLHIKKIAYIVFVAVIAFVALILLVYFLLWLSPVQQKVKDIVLGEIMKMTSNSVNVNKIYLRPFNSIQLEQIYVDDLKRDTLLYAGNLSAKFDLRGLLKRRLLIKSVELKDFIIKINKDSIASDYNFQFLVDAFSSSSRDTVSSGLDLQIRNITFKNGQVCYDILSEPALNDSLFDGNHIHISQIQSKIDLNSIDIKRLDVKIRSLSFMEKSGFTVEQVQATACSNNNRIEMKDGLFRFPHSQLIIPKAWVIVEKGEWGKMRFVCGENHVEPVDFKMFYAGLSYFPDNLKFSGEIRGTYPQLELCRFQVDYSNHICFNLQGFIQDFHKWENTPLNLKLKSLSIDEYGMNRLLQLPLGVKIKKLPVDVKKINLTGSVDGKISDLEICLELQSDRGSVFLEGNGGYNPDSGNSYWDVECRTNNLDVKSLLQDSIYGLADCQLQIKGKLASDGKIDMEGTSTINRFDFNGYSYNRITATGSYSEDNISLNVNSEDKKVDLNLSLSANIGEKSPGIKLYASTDCIYLDTLNILPEYKNAFLMATVLADIKGFDLEKMKAELSINNFSFYTDKGLFHEPHFRLDYQAADKGNKSLKITSQTIDARMSGMFTYAGIFESLKEAFPPLFPESKPEPKKKDLVAENFNFRVGMNNIHLLSDILDLPQAVPDSILFIGRYGNDGKNLHLSTSAYTLFAQSDTLQLSLSLANKENNLAVIFNVDNKSIAYDFDGSIDAEIAFVSQEKSSVPNVQIRLNPAVFVLNETSFNMHPAQVEIRNGIFELHNLSLSHADDPDEYIKADGVISKSRNDSLTIDISKFKLNTIFGTIKSKIPLTGVAAGQIVAKSLLSTPVILTRKFSVNDLMFSGKELGNLNVTSVWSGERNGLILRAALNRTDHLQSTVSGFILPEKDSVSITANIRDVELKWLQEIMEGTLFGLSGSVNADVKVAGKISNPAINGIVYFNNAKIGINKLNSLYSINDSIYLSSDLIELKRFTISDENQRTLVATGKITHQKFTGWNPNLSLSLSDFLIINNEDQTDSLFYGILRVNGVLNVKKNNKDWLLTGDIIHSNETKLTINIPTTTMAERYNSITYIDPYGEEMDIIDNQDKSEGGLMLPLRINVSFWIDPSLSIGAVFNPITGDAARVRGNGTVKLSYDLNNSSMTLLGDYEVESGNATLTVVNNISKKTFEVQKGGKLVFKGDPLATTFDLTALYNQRADLVVLDGEFENMGLTRTKVPVTCSLTAVGRIDKMELKYDLFLPDESEEVQRRFKSLLFSDEIKIKEMAYLLALGTFLPASSSHSNSNLWASLASSSITGQLNNLLSNVLKNEHWSVGTSLRTKDSGFESMDINISTQLFNDRLTMNSTVSYHNDPTQKNNITGDFEVKYKLISSGNILLKFFNTTNNQYFDQAKTTQGVGIIYKRESRTFKKLFDKFKKKNNE
jgi:hypothetical protein